MDLCVSGPFLLHENWPRTVQSWKLSEGDHILSTEPHASFFTQLHLWRGSNGGPDKADASCGWMYHLPVLATETLSPNIVVDEEDGVGTVGKLSLGEPVTCFQPPHKDKEGVCLPILCFMTLKKKLAYSALRLPVAQWLSLLFTFQILIWYLLC